MSQLLDLKKADTIPAWCPGCGNFPILKAFSGAFAESGLNPEKTVLVSGIGQAAKLPHYLEPPCNIFNGLHGRALPAATGIKCANHELEVIVTSGDGDMYGEGGNHFIHAIRRNIGLKVFVHNNQVYGLTKGQASPTSDEGFVTRIQTHGVMSTPFNPLALAIVEGCSMVARTCTGDPVHLKATMLEALRQKEGFVLVDILQPCVSFNQINTYKWYKERMRPIPPEHDPYDRMKALALAFQWGDSIPTGIIYRSRRPSFESRQPVLRQGSLVTRIKQKTLEQHQ
ncbi:MAG: 2-oxoacid ferredoxin oxidoreductase [Lentisphaerae bacterium RIFOXYA12_FULL_48_11]|nr:MAG: 2-oxoacid ferredoxin oxidoreductase [Lentisphaerae bacterium RIFOXYA12_FULL_48_11]